MEYDFLGLLQQLQKETTEQSTEQISTESNTKQHIPLQTPSPSVVGPTTEELESINELIKFDHEYFKVEKKEVKQCVSPVPVSTSKPPQQIAPVGAESEINQQGISISS